MIKKLIDRFRYPKAKIEIYRDGRGQWRMRKVAANGNILIFSEGYRNKQDVMKLLKYEPRTYPVILLDEFRKRGIKHGSRNK